MHGVCERMQRILNTATFKLIPKSWKFGYIYIYMY